MISSEILAKDFSGSRNTILDTINPVNSGILYGTSDYKIASKVQSIHMEIVSWAKLCQEQIKEEGEFAKIYAGNLLKMFSEVDEIIQDTITEITTK